MGDRASRLSTLLSCWAAKACVLISLAVWVSAAAAVDGPPDVPAVRIVLGPLYVTLSDAMGAVKSGDSGAASDRLKAMQLELRQLDPPDTEKGRRLSRQLALAIERPVAAQLAALSNALRDYEQEQNPVDHSAKRAEFKRRIAPALTMLERSIAQAAADGPVELPAAYQRFNAVWVGSERVVRNTSPGHYGAIEVAMALLRVAIETQPVDLVKIGEQARQLRRTIESYNGGETRVVEAATLGLPDGLRLLREALDAFEAGRLPEGRAQLRRFIDIWPAIEGEVSTRAPELYRRVEGEVPLVLAHGEDPWQQGRLREIVEALSKIDSLARYGAVDAMLILLREGLEALLVVMALVGALNAAGQEAARRWVHLGVLAGLGASVLVAWGLQRLFPAAIAGSHREMVEGAAGVATVVMMLMVGAWLHGKSSLRSWNLYIKRHMGRALGTGSLLSIAGLSFLAVFREGAETLLFFIGILPRIDTGDFLRGVGMAVLVLAATAVFLFRSSYKLPMARMFKVLTWLIYALGFKILGVSVHALQLSGHLPWTPWPAQALEVAGVGLFATVETLSAQAAYLVCVGLVHWAVRRNEDGENPDASTLKHGPVL